MSVDINISVVDAIRCEEFQPQGCDGEGYFLPGEPEGGSWYCVLGC